MKATLTFDTVEDAAELRIAINIPGVMRVLSDLDQDLRSKVKYDQDLPDGVRDALSKVRELLWEGLTEEGLCPSDWL
jgi:hypothetical protein